MTTIRDVIARDLDRKIEEIVKVNQDDTETVYNEIIEYVPTEHINREYFELFKAIAEGMSTPDEGVGVWVSGFFGSGKSSFAKNLGYALRNVEIAGTKSGALLADQLDDAGITSRIDFITHKVKTTVIMFDVQERGGIQTGVQTGNEPIAEIVYNVLLSELGYPDDWTLAELEMDLEREGKLDRFLRLVQTAHGDGIPTGNGAERKTWLRIAKGPQRLNRTSAILHQIDPATYPQVDSWALSVRGITPRLEVGEIVRRLFDLMIIRRPGEALALIIDEVGQYVGRSADKIENLRVLIEQIGKEGANRVKKKHFPAPVWVVVTSQERLDEVVTVLDNGLNLLPKLQDRFRHRVDLVPSDIREVATKRVLGKSPEGEKALSKLFADYGGRLQSYAEFERSTRKTELEEAEFIQFYPFLPHFIDLSIDVVTGLRARSSGFRQTGAANRTIIKQAHEMLIGEPNLADAALGTLVTLDKVYDLVRHSNAFDQNHKIELDRIRTEFGAGSWEERVVKSLALLELVKNLPRTDKNIAAVLYDRLGAESPQPHVRNALDRLLSGQYVREAEDGWKLQTAEEKNWEKERQTIDPKPKDRNEAIREAIGKSFADADLRNYKLRGRTFKVGTMVQIGQSGMETRIGDDGQIAIHLRVAEPGESFDAAKSTAQDFTRQPKQLNTLIWTAMLESDIDELARDLLRSKAMINKYDGIAAQGKIQGEEKTLLQDEKALMRRIELRLVEKVGTTLFAGTGYHTGNTYDGSDLGNTLGEAIRGFLGKTMPQIYPKLVAVSLKGSEADELLKAANLNNVPTVLHDGDTGLGLVIKRDGHYVINDQAQTAEEVMRHLIGQKDYGVSVSGKTITDHFAEPPFGWEQDLLRLVLAALMRGGKITVTANGQQHKNYNDPTARQPFSGPKAFNSATFEFREDDQPPTLKEIQAAFLGYEELTGGTIDYDAEAIATGFRIYATDAAIIANEIDSRRLANGLPEDPDVTAYRSMLTSVPKLDTNDAVRLLGGSAKTLKDGREATRRIEGALGSHLQGIKRAQTALKQMWPTLRQDIDQLPAELGANALDLSSLLEGAEIYVKVNQTITAGSAIARFYEQHYDAKHALRASTYADAIKTIKEMPEWATLDPVDQEDRAARESKRDTVLAELVKRSCTDLDFTTDGVVCRHCRAGLGQIESDLIAVEGLRQKAATRLRELAMPTITTRPVRISTLALSTITSEADIAPALAQIEAAIRAALFADGGNGENTVVVLE